MGTGKGGPVACERGWTSDHRTQDVSDLYRNGVGHDVPFYPLVQSRPEYLTTGTTTTLPRTLEPIPPPTNRDTVFGSRGSEGQTYRVQVRWVRDSVRPGRGGRSSSVSRPLHEGTPSSLLYPVSSPRRTLVVLPEGSPPPEVRTRFQVFTLYGSKTLLHSECPRPSGYT